MGDHPYTPEKEAERELEDLEWVIERFRGDNYLHTKNACAGTFTAA